MGLQAPLDTIPTGFILEIDRWIEGREYSQPRSELSEPVMDLMDTGNGKWFAPRSGFGPVA